MSSLSSRYATFRNRTYRCVKKSEKKCSVSYNKYDTYMKIGCDKSSYYIAKSICDNEYDNKNITTR